MILGLVAGYVDAYGFLRYQTYVSFMSGNTTQAGFRFGLGQFVAAIPHILALLAFVTGVFAGTLLLHSGVRRPHRWLFSSVALLLLASIAVTLLSGILALASIMVLSMAMGFMNTTLSRVGRQTINLVFVTGTLNNMARNFALALKKEPLPDSQGPWDSHSRRGMMLLRTWMSFLVGAVVASALIALLGVWDLLLPLIIMIALSVFPGQPDSTGLQDL